MTPVTSRPHSETLWALSVQMGWSAASAQSSSSSPLSPPLFHFPLRTQNVVEPRGVNGWPPPHSQVTIAFDSQWWERERKGAHCTFSWIRAVVARAPTALKWMLPLMVKSIRDGDGVARPQTVTIGDYKSTTPLPQHSPLPHSHLALPFWMKWGDFRRV